MIIKICLKLFLDKTKELLPLCREYQVTWLTKRIQNHLNSLSYSELSTRQKLAYLEIADEYGFSELRKFLLEKSGHFDDSFVFIQTLKEFNNLKENTKYEIAKHRLSLRINLNKYVISDASTLVWFLDKLFKNKWN